MLKRISVTIIAVFVLSVCCAFTQGSQTQEDSVSKIKIMDYPKIFHGREPLKLKDNGGNKLQVRNASKQGVTKFILYFVASKKGGKLHGPGAHRHTFPIYWGYDTPELLPAGETVEISLEEGMKAHANNPDADPNNTEIWAFEVRFEDSGKMWRMGQFLKNAGNKWEQDFSLSPAPSGLPKRNSFLGQFDGRCWDYDNSVNWPQNWCTHPDCTSCKYESPQFRQVYGGYPLVLNCMYCLVPGQPTVCQKPNGSACTQPNINDLDISNPCTF